MGLHIGAVAIQGDHRQDMPQILEQWGYRLLEKPQTVSSRDAAVKMQHRDVKHTQAMIAVSLVDGWTLLSSRDIDLWWDKKLMALLQTISSEKKVPVLGWMVESCSETNGFMYIYNNAVRYIYAIDGQIFEDVGKPLEQESGIEWTEAGQGEIEGLCKRLNVPFDAIEDHEYSFVFVERKKWWKFWK